MKLIEIKHLAIDLMDRHGLTSQGWYFEFDNAKNRAGVCRFNRKVIGLSRVLMPHMKPEKIKDTILHEIAHALVGARHGHDRVWQRKALEIGCNADRCWTHNDLNEGSAEVLAKQSKYTLTCPSCGQEHGMHRKPKAKRSCGKCSGGRYNPKYKMVVTQNY
jgi:predicted SprT family Zn-dependent metalloprotease